MDRLVNTGDLERYAVVLDNGHKYIIVPYGKRKPVPPPKKRIPVKCSTCGNRKRRERFGSVEWKHCGKWFPGGVKND